MKEILVVANAHVYKTEKDCYFTNNIYNNAFFSRYLFSFDKVIFCCKVNKISVTESKKLHKLEIDGLTIFELPWYRGLIGLIKNLPRIIQSMKSITKDKNYLLLRMTQFESILAYLLRDKKSKLAIELINDAKEYYRGIFSFISFIMTRHIIKKADAISYITDNYLQSKYTTQTNKKVIISSYQTVDLDKGTIIKKFFNTANPQKYFKIIHVANNIVGSKKGHFVILKIIKYLNKRNIKVTATFVGDGKGVNKLFSRAKRYNIEKLVTFKGRIYDKNKLINYLNEMDLFVFPSKSEGLGRVNLEAMCAGLPVLASNVGGITELFDEKYLFKWKDYKSFSKKIIELINNPYELNEMSNDNIQKVMSYTTEFQTQKRKSFFNDYSNL